FEDVVRDADVVLDTIGGDTLERSFKALKKESSWCRLYNPLRKNRLRNMEFARCSMADIPVHLTWLKSQS
ncbi:MAG TPA: hypothetical protein VN639_09670, partial [Azonexus sp.]|nr:hypothetical protein [Azonexus sp.]